MCKLVEIVRDAIPSNISIEFQRDASKRAFDVFIINSNRDGHNEQGVKIVCFDNGKIIVDGCICNE